METIGTIRRATDRGSVVLGGGGFPKLLNPKPLNPIWRFRV